MPLTDDARKELQEAIRIVREDRFEKFVRGRMKSEDKDPPQKDPLIDPEKDPEKDPTPPPGKDPEKDPEKDAPKPKSAWWGELMND